MTSLVIAMLLAGPLLEAPWACESTYPCTQGNGGATSHTGLAQYAWDFGIPAGTDVHAAHGGTVLMVKKDSYVGGCSSQYANDANYVLIDHGDGTAGLYLHLEGGSSNVSVGQGIAAGDTIGRVGQTGWACGAHLHFQTQQICGSWWCQSVPSEFYGHGVLAYPESMTSENCGPCTAVLDGGVTTISESEVQCFDRLTKWWWDAGEGLEGHHWYTHTTAAASADTIGRWRFSVTTPGDYQVEVNIPAGNADSQSAKYRVHHAGQVSEVVVDQAGQKGWRTLGTFDFDGGGDEFLELPDNTGEDYSLMRPLAYDSARFTFVDQGGTTGTGDGGTTGTSDGGTTGTTTGTTTDGDCPLGQPGCMCTPGGGCDPGAICIQGYCTPDNAGGSESDSDGSSGTAGGDEWGDDLGVDRDGGSCACSGSGSGSGWAGVLMTLFGLGLLRRRRDPARPRRS